LSIDFSKDTQYHSIFVCPVTRDLVTGRNPAIMLKCGHILSENAVMRLAHNNQRKVKCPYCPLEQTISEIKTVYFN